MAASTSEKEREKLRDFKLLSQLAERAGISVRREKLARGHSYRVKSGECVLGGKNLVFVDKRLPIEQQLIILTDFLVDLRVEIDPEEGKQLTAATRSLILQSMPSANPGSSQLKASKLGDEVSPQQETVEQAVS